MKNAMTSLAIVGVLSSDAYAMEGSSYQPELGGSYNPSYLPSDQPRFGESSYQPGVDIPYYQPGESYAPSYQPSYQPGYGGSYIPSYQPGYGESYTPSYQPSYQPGYGGSYIPSYQPGSQSGGASYQYSYSPPKQGSGGSKEFYEDY